MRRKHTTHTEEFHACQKKSGIPVLAAEALCFFCFARVGASFSHVAPLNPCLLQLASRNGYMYIAFSPYPLLRPRSLLQVAELRQKAELMASELSITRDKLAQETARRLNAETALRQATDK